MKQNTTFENYKKRLHDILSFFNKICRENGIKYSIVDGTLLGAIRHKGMIPWDGDVDVALTPKEFEKLKNVLTDYEGKYYLNYLPNHVYRAKGRSHDFPTTTAKLIDKTCSSSIFGIDVLTIDYLGDDYEKAKKIIGKYKLYDKLIRYTASAHIPEGRSLKRSVATIIYPIWKLISIVISPIIINSYLKFREREMDANNDDCKYCTYYRFINNKVILPNDLLSQGYTDLEFDGLSVMSAKNYEAYLKPSYGNYMELPKESDRIPYPSKEILEEVQFD